MEVIFFSQIYVFPAWFILKNLTTILADTPKFSHAWLSPVRPSHPVGLYVLLILPSNCFSSLAHPSFSSLSFSSLGLLITPDRSTEKAFQLPCFLHSVSFQSSSLYAVQLVIFSTHYSTSRMFLLYKRKKEGREEGKEREREKARELVGRAIAHPDSLLFSVTNPTLTYNGHSSTFLPLCLSPSSFLCL